MDRGVHLTLRQCDPYVDGRNYWVTNTNPNLTLGTHEQSINVTGSIERYVIWTPPPVDLTQ